MFFRKRRALWRKRRRLIERLLRSNSKDYKDSLTDNIAKLDTELKQWFEKEKIDEENKAINNITANSKYFFSYAKKKLKTQSKVGPMYKENNIIDDSKEMADCLQEQFKSVFSEPDKDKHINNIN